MTEQPNHVTAVSHLCGVGKRSVAFERWTPTPADPPAESEHGSPVTAR